VTDVPARILLIKPSSLGDVVHALPVLSLLRRRWPKAHISWLIADSFAGLIEAHPQLDEVIRFDRRRFAAAWWNPAALRDLFCFKRSLREHHFDLVIDLQGLLRSAIVGRVARSPRRVGFRAARELAWLLYTDRVAVEPSDAHAVDRYLAAAASIGCGREPVDFTFPPTSSEDETVVQELIGPNCDQRFAVLLPGTNWPTKRWPAQNFAALVRPLRERFGLTGLVAGGAEARPLAAQIPDALDVTGRTTLPQLVALLRRASLVIANDSGPMHIAAALGRPLVAMFGPTNPHRTGPWRRDDSVVRVDIPCSPCYSRRCSHTSCMKWLPVEAVLNVAARQLAAMTTRSV
jgi:lipopolysaccharide heptosyltransferase I